MLSVFRKFTQKSNEVNPDTLRPGHLGNLRYSLKKEIARGAQGVVHLAQDNVTGKKFAVKEIFSLKSVPDLEMVHSEILLLKNSNHINLLKLEDIYLPTNTSDPNQVFLVFEYLPYTLNYVITQAHIRVCQEDISFIIYQIMAGIYHLHKSGIVHRDINPKNIGVYPNFTIKVLDFGISKQMDEGNTNTGTDLYKAPEILTDRPHGNKIDVWSVGIIMCGLILRRKYDFTNLNVIRRLTNDTFDWNAMFPDKKFPPYGMGNDSNTNGSVLRKVTSIIPGRKNITSSTRRRCINPENARDLMKHMLRPDPDIRISAWDAIQHDYLRAYQEPSELDADPIECKGNLNKENSVINLEFKEALVEQIHQIAAEFQARVV